MNKNAQIEKDNQLLSRVRGLAWGLLSATKMLREFVWDFSRYSRLSTPTSRTMLSRLEGRNLECQVTKDYHRIEKGLALPAPKRPFGADPADRLARALRDRRAGDIQFFSHASTALEALQRWNQEGHIEDFVSPRGATLSDVSLSVEGLKSLFESRRSIRNFKPSEAVPMGIVRTAVDYARHTPSVCNRQTARAHYFSDTADINRLLKHQSGNRGFGDSASGLFVITSDVRLFSGSGERNQRWIDGGLFAMSLVWALHGSGIGTCMLNWSKSNNESRMLRAAAGINEAEDIIVLIAIGYPNDDYRVARSPLRSIDEMFEVH